MTLALWIAGYAAPAAHAQSSSYTRIDEAGCGPAPRGIAADYEARGLGVQQCGPAPAGYRLYLVSSNERSWIDLQTDVAQWSSERTVVYGDGRAPVAQFPNVGGTVVEWRHGADGAPYALIFRITALDPNDPERSRSRLFVARLRPEPIAVIGQVATNVQARQLADSVARPPP